MKKVYSFLLAMTYISCMVFAQVSLDSALVASYYFNNNFNDSSGNGHHAANAGATFASDRFGAANAALYFDGSVYVDLPNDVRFQPQSSASLSFWMKSNQTGRFDLFEQRIGNNYPSDLNFNITFNYPSTQRINFNFPNYNLPPNNYTSHNVLSENAIDGKWHHMVFVKDVNANTMSIYQDDSLLGVKNIQDISFTVNGTLRIGKEISGSYWYTGYIDDIRIYSRALNNNEVTELYQGNASATNNDALPQLISLYPNPATDKVYLKNPFSGSTIHSVSVYDYTGKLQFVQTENPLEIETSSLPAGMYFIVLLSAGHETISGRFVKE
jgi:hypothetical protein